MEDEKQLRILNQLFVPLSQAMPALAAAQDQQMLTQAAKAMQYIIAKQIELSGSASAKDIGLMWKGDVEAVDERDRRIEMVESELTSLETGMGDLVLMQGNALSQLQDQMSMMREAQQLLMEKLGVLETPTGVEEPQDQMGSSTPLMNPSSVITASA
jgi:hypothetical protein